MPVEDRVRKLEDTVGDLGTDVATLTGRVNESIRQGDDRHIAHMDLAEKTLGAINNVAADVGIIKALDVDRKDRGGLLTADFPAQPALNGKARVVAYGAGGFGALWIVVELVGKVLEVIKGLP